MTIDALSTFIREWMDQHVRELRREFDSRLLCVGLQGSYRRREQRPDSDYDVVVILDKLGMADLAKYRAIVESMPNSEYACGFISGARELRNWPRHELFHFQRDTLVWHGDLDRLIPPISRQDIETSIRTGAGALYHTLVHTYVHGKREDWPDCLHRAYRSTFYILQSRHFLQTDRYCATRRELADALTSDERDLIVTSFSRDQNTRDIPEDPEADFERLIGWCCALLDEYGTTT